MRLRGAAVVLAVVAVGCAGGGGDTPVLLVASSLADVAADLARAWGRPVHISEGGSHTLAAQVRAGAPADALLLADPDLAEDLAAAGLATPPRTVAATGLAVAVSRRAAGRVRHPADLTDARLRVVLADVEVPLGRYTDAALRRLEAIGAAPPGTAAAVRGGADSLEDSARAVLAKVMAGDADAAVVYRTDAEAAERAAGAVTVVGWPADADVAAVYTLQVLPRARPAAAELVAFLTGPRARTVWARHGFSPHHRTDAAAAAAVGAGR